MNNHGDRQGRHESKPLLAISAAIDKEKKGHRISMKMRSQGAVNRRSIVVSDRILLLYYTRTDRWTAAVVVAQTSSRCADRCCVMHSTMHNSLYTTVHIPCTTHRPVNRTCHVFGRYSRLRQQHNGHPWTMDRGRTASAT